MPEFNFRKIYYGYYAGGHPEYIIAEGKKYFGTIQILGKEKDKKLVKVILKFSSEESGINFEINLKDIVSCTVKSETEYRRWLIIFKKEIEVGRLLVSVDEKYLGKYTVHFILESLPAASSLRNEILKYKRRYEAELFDGVKYDLNENLEALKGLIKDMESYEKSLDLSSTFLDFGKITAFEDTFTTIKRSLKETADQEKISQLREMTPHKISEIDNLMNEIQNVEKQAEEKLNEIVDKYQKIVREKKDIISKFLDDLENKISLLETDLALPRLNIDKLLEAYNLLSESEANIASFTSKIPADLLKEFDYRFTSIQQKLKELAAKIHVKMTDTLEQNLNSQIEAIKAQFRELLAFKMRSIDDLEQARAKVRAARESAEKLTKYSQALDRIATIEKFRTIAYDLKDKIRKERIPIAEQLYNKLADLVKEQADSFEKEFNKYGIAPDQPLPETGVNELEGNIIHFIDVLRDYVFLLDHLDQNKRKNLEHNISEIKERFLNTIEKARSRKRTATNISDLINITSEILDEQSNLIRWIEQKTARKEFQYLVDVNIEKVYFPLTIYAGTYLISRKFLPFLYDHLFFNLFIYSKSKEATKNENYARPFNRLTYSPLVLIDQMQTFESELSDISKKIGNLKIPFSSVSAPIYIFDYPQKAYVSNAPKQPIFYVPLDVSAYGIGLSLTNICESLRLYQLETINSILSMFQTYLDGKMKNQVGTIIVGLGGTSKSVLQFTDVITKTLLRRPFKGLNYRSQIIWWINDYLNLSEYELQWDIPLILIWLWYMQTKEKKRNESLAKVLINIITSPPNIENLIHVVPVADELIINGLARNDVANCARVWDRRYNNRVAISLLNVKRIQYTEIKSFDIYKAREKYESGGVIIPHGLADKIIESIENAFYSIGDFEYDMSLVKGILVTLMLPQEPSFLIENLKKELKGKLVNLPKRCLLEIAPIYFAELPPVIIVRVVLDAKDLLFKILEKLGIVRKEGTYYLIDDRRTFEEFVKHLNETIREYRKWNMTTTNTELIRRKDQIIKAWETFKKEVVKKLREKSQVDEMEISSGDEET